MPKIDRSEKMPVERGLLDASERLPRFALTETSESPFKRQPARVGHDITARGKGKD
jgi:hypothetical protein